jgi:heparin/heparan-sulfate lyase
MAPQYNYLAGDITNAYSDKTKLVTRSLVALNLADATYPAMLVVFDRVTAAKPKLRKAWVLHSLQEPKIDGTTTTVVCDGTVYLGTDRYGGKLEVRSLLPESPTVRKIGGPGKEFWVESTQTNYEPRKRPEQRHVDLAEAGAWRIEISPLRATKTDYFLHTLTVMDATVKAGPKVEAICSEQYVGIAALDRVVLFSRSPAPQTKAAFELTQPGNTHVLICDLAPGLWRVTCDGESVAVDQPVTQSVGSLYITGGRGRYELIRTSEVAPPEAPAAFWTDLARASQTSVGNDD